MRCDLAGRLASQPASPAVLSKVGFRARRRASVCLRDRSSDGPGVFPSAPRPSEKTRIFTALRTIEHHPGHEVVAELLKPVHHACRHEQDVARLKRVPPIAIYE